MKSNRGLWLGNTPAVSAAYILTKTSSLLYDIIQSSKERQQQQTSIVYLQLK